MAMKVKRKLQLLTILPLLVLFLLLGGQIINHFQEVRDNNQILQYVHMTQYNSALVHELQKERGTTAGWMGSKSDAFAAKLKAQRQLTDKQLSQWRKEIGELNVSSSNLQSLQQRILAKLDNIGTTRSAVDNDKISLRDALTYYTSLNAELLSAAGLIGHISQNAELTREIYAYDAYLQAKERAGIERAVLSNTFSANQFAPGLFARFVTLVAEQKTYSSRFTNQVTPELKQSFIELEQSDAFQTVEKMRRVAMDNATTGNFGIKGPDWFDAATQRINALKAFENKISANIDEFTQNLLDDARYLLWCESAALILIIVVIGGLTRSIVLNIERQLTSLTTTLKQIRQRHDLTLRIEVSGNGDEFCQIGESVNETLAEVASALNEVKNTAAELSSAAELTMATIENTQSSLHTQSEETVRVSAAIEQVSASVSEVAQSTTQASEAAHLADELSQDGRRKMTKALATIEHLHQDIVEVGKVTNELQESSQTISSVIDVINSISEQTNLLALNAAIEAARAGDQGRGFAVVADEVRTLAQRTHGSTTQIEEIIERLCQQTQMASTKVDTNSKDMNETLTEASAIGSSLSEIGTAIGNINQLSTQIAAATQEQSSVVAEISHSVTRIDSNSQAINQQADTMTQQANQLTKLSGRLNTLIGRFEL